MKILIFGDIIGRSGRQALKEFLPRFRTENPTDFVIANGENLAHGSGITEKTANEILDMGVNLITTGNHVWDAKQALELLQRESRIIRPANFPPGLPGKGSTVVKVGIVSIAVLNLMGRVFFRREFDDPFRAIEEWLAKLPRVQPLITLVDLHAEATSERRAISHFLDGKVTAVWGTHTHIPTADEQILPHGTAYITDIGMVGALHSVLGFQAGPVIERFRTQIETPFIVEENQPWEVDALYLDVDEKTAKARNILRIREII